MAFCGLDGKPLSIRTKRLGFVLIFFVDFQVLCRVVVSGRVPKEFANLTNLANSNLYGNQLQVPGGAPTDSDGDMIIYGSRKKVAAFQACLK